MVLLLTKRALSQGSGGVLELSQHASVSRLKPSLLCGWQLGRDLEVDQIDERLADLLQALLQLGGGG
jgi:hypothetical protein